MFDLLKIVPSLAILPSKWIIILLLKFAVFSAKWENIKELEGDNKIIPLHGKLMSHSLIPPRPPFTYNALPLFNYLTLAAAAAAAANSPSFLVKICVAQWIYRNDWMKDIQT